MSQLYTNKQKQKRVLLYYSTIQKRSGPTLLTFTCKTLPFSQFELSKSGHFTDVAWQIIIVIKCNSKKFQINERNKPHAFPASPVLQPMGNKIQLSNVSLLLIGSGWNQLIREAGQARYEWGGRYGCIAAAQRSSVVCVLLSKAHNDKVSKSLGDGGLAGRTLLNLKLAL